MPGIEAEFFIPLEKREEFDRLFGERNEIVRQFNSLMNKITPISPNPKNYEECSNSLAALVPEVHSYCQRALNCVNEFESYELNLSYDYSGHTNENFKFLEFKLRVSNFIRSLQRQSDTVIKSVNDTWSEIKVQESLSLTSQLAIKVSKFVRHHPILFIIELIVHIAVIILGLKELRVI